MRSVIEEIKRFLILGMFLFSYIIVAQDVDEQETERDLQILQISDFFSQAAQSNATTLQNNMNRVFIQQIGSNNSVNAFVRSSSSDITVLQNGNSNVIDINETADEVIKVLEQTGDNNRIIDFSFAPNSSTSLELIQDGSNLIFEKFGSNELSNSLKFQMSGADRTIIVRSF